ncbi:MAG: hypothetical protein OCD02_23130 [Spirochaetaceae bacterium]
MNSYRIKKERERVLFSSLVVFASVVFIALFSFIFDLFQFEDFTEYTGPVKITFGSPDGLDDIIIPTNDINKDVVEPIEEPPSDPKVEPEPIIEPIPDIVEPVPNEPKIIEPELTTPKESTIDTKSDTRPEPIIQKGEENGNSHETSFDSESSSVRRSVYSPIWQFMPLPQSITEDLYALINGDVTGFDEEDYNRDLFNDFYTKSGDTFQLNSYVEFDDRPYLWAILKDSGYNMEEPEFKEKYTLKTIIITFEIGNSLNGQNIIKSSEVTTSSGVPKIDEAVLHGFNQSTYSNSTEKSVTGRFKYSFK